MRCWRCDVDENYIDDITQNENGNKKNKGSTNSGINVQAAAIMTALAALSVLPGVKAHREDGQISPVSNRGANTYFADLSTVDFSFIVKAVIIWTILIYAMGLATGYALKTAISLAAVTPSLHGPLLSPPEASAPPDDTSQVADATEMPTEMPTDIPEPNRLKVHYKRAYYTRYGEKLHLDPKCEGLDWRTSPLTTKDFCWYCAPRGVFNS